MSLYNQRCTNKYTETTPVNKRDVLKVALISEAVVTPPNGKKKTLESKLRSYSSYNCIIQNVNSMCVDLLESIIFLPKSTTTFFPFTSLCKYHHVLTLCNSAKSIVACISLKDISVTQEDSHTFIIQNSGHTFSCKAGTEEDCSFWVSTLKQLNSPKSITPKGGFFKPTEKSLAAMKKRCTFSSKIVTDGEFKGGKLSDIIQYVLFYCSTATADNIFLHGLLIHVKLENSFYEFLSELKSVFSKCCDVNSPSMSTSWKKRITNALLQMCRSYRLLSFKQRMQLLRSCEDFLFEAKDTLYSYTIVNPETQPKEVVPNHILPQWGLQENNLLELPTKLIAEQLTFFESKLHHQLEFTELVHNTGVTLGSIVCWWNQMASWTSSAILCEPTPKSQKQLYKVFLRVAEHCMELRNYNTVAQIITGLKHHSVSRLRGLQEQLGPQLKRIERLEELVSPKDNYAQYRSAPKESPCLHFLAVHQRDIRFICDSNPKYLDKKKTILNFERLSMLGNCYATMGLNYPTTSYDFDIEPDHDFQELLCQLKNVSEDDLFTLSFCSEPNRGGEAPVSKKKDSASVHQNPLHQSLKLKKHYSKGPREQYSRKRSLSESEGLNQVHQLMVDDAESTSLNRITRTSSSDKSPKRKSPISSFLSKKNPFHRQQSSASRIGSLKDGEYWRVQRQNTN